MSKRILDIQHMSSEDLIKEWKILNLKRIGKRIMPDEARLMQFIADELDVRVEKKRLADRQRQIAEDAVQAEAERRAKQVTPIHMVHVKARAQH